MREKAGRENNNNNVKSNAPVLQKSPHNFKSWERICYLDSFSVHKTLVKSTHRSPTRWRESPIQALWEEVWAHCVVGHSQSKAFLQTIKWTMFHNQSQAFIQPMNLTFTNLRKTVLMKRKILYSSDSLLHKKYIKSVSKYLL